MTASTLSQLSFDPRSAVRAADRERLGEVRMGVPGLSWATKGCDAVRASILLSTLVVFGVGIGTLLQRRFSQRSMLSYGVGFLIAVLPMLLIALAFKRQ
jgi:hypothetical protein